MWPSSCCNVLTPTLSGPCITGHLLEDSLICLQRSSAIPIDSVVTREVQLVLAVRIQCEALVVLLLPARHLPFEQDLSLLTAIVFAELAAASASCTALK